MPISPDKLRTLRRSLGLTQAELAARLGWPHSVYARIETGARTDPRLSTAEAIARGLGVTVDQIVTGERREAQ